MSLYINLSIHGYSKVYIYIGIGIGRWKMMRKDIYDTNYERIIELIPDLTSLKIGDYRKSEAPGFMDLHLDILDKNESEMKIALSHNYKQNGDTMADPDMEIRVYLIDGWRKAEALTYQQDGLGLYQEVYPSQGYVRPKLKTQLNSFLRQWLINLKHQGHSLMKQEDDQPTDWGQAVLNI